jgi:hypothetical protein
MNSVLPVRERGARAVNGLEPFLILFQERGDVHFCCRVYLRKGQPVTLTLEMANLTSRPKKVEPSAIRNPTIANKVLSIAATPAKRHRPSRLQEATRRHARRARTSNPPHRPRERATQLASPSAQLKVKVQR